MPLQRSHCEKGVLHSGHSPCCSTTSVAHPSHMVQCPQGRRVWRGASKHTMQSLGLTLPLSRRSCRWRARMSARGCDFRSCRHRWARSKKSSRISAGHSTLLGTSSSGTSPKGLPSESSTVGNDPSSCRNTTPRCWRSALLENTKVGLTGSAHGLFPTLPNSDVSGELLRLPPAFGKQHGLQPAETGLVSALPERTPPLPLPLEGW
mmetsp:Transcript_142058/g.247658  ORF Transcript_142058/g.247658 Transcript_142058/m.247658 type:complete len:206 (-) Transcript_142058:610-1227(-)